VWTTQFFCLTGLAAVQWQFGDKFSFNRSAEEYLNKFKLVYTRAVFFALFVPLL
jgi:hypothetical protein